MAFYFFYFFLSFSFFSFLSFFSLSSFFPFPLSPSPPLPLLLAAEFQANFGHAPPLHSHASAHVLSFPGHEIAVDVDGSELFCCACRDQVCDRDFDAAVVLAQTITATAVAATTSTSRSAAVRSAAVQCSAAGSQPENLRKR